LRYGAVGGAAVFVGGGVASAQATPTASGDTLESAIDAILADARYAPSRLGIYVADLHTEEALVDIRGDEWFLVASTTKLFTTAAALDALGPDYQFVTPVYRTGPIGSDGTLDGDLILVASGDLTMGGRDTPDGQIEYTRIDHINATAFPELVTLTAQDPLAGLNDFARQIAESGIQQISGDVIIDDRLFPAIEKDGYVLTPVWINDNLIDFVVKPGEVGAAATIDWRPKSPTFQVEENVLTVAADEPVSLRVTSPAPGQLVVEGQIPVTMAQAVPTFQIDDPSAFARTLLIEALARAGVSVAASPGGKNPVDELPPQGSYADADQVAERRSLPFSENLKLVNKTSHNQHADMLIMLLSLHNDETTFEAGMLAVRSIIEQAGIDPADVALGDGRGNLYTDLFSPHTVTRLLAYMATRPDFPAYSASLPVLGVDGTESTTVKPTSPVAGNAAAKSGTTFDDDPINQRGVVMTRALAGYLTGRSGRECVFGVYINNVPVGGLDDILTLITEHGSIVEAIHDRT